MSPLLLALMVMQGTVYSWTDKSGVEHFTDDLAAIPRGVKVRTTEGAEISRIDSDVAKNPRPVAVPPTTQPAVPSTSEQAWRQLFRTARTRVIELEEEIESDRKKVEEVNGLPVRSGFICNTGFYNQPMVTTGVVVNGQPLPGLGVSATVTGTTVIHQQVPLYASPCFFSFNPEFERIRERLDKNRREVVRAREELADLERRASFEAVPLHWRR
ncbi:MAG: DUF4124 domain-containing protein [Archangium sp.]|nr:DUF4124 domain-containing protein [Archangium sp.]MDP3152921.1 DUF4124 domain-containing protein [Archangium sp.]MDP3569921.1 DUF4124 domain-containing protein [Archangium sp.]